MRKRMELPCDSSRIRDGLDFIKEALKERNVSSKDITRTVLTSEEVLAKLNELGLSLSPGEEA